MHNNSILVQLMKHLSNIDQCSHIQRRSKGKKIESIIHVLCICQEYNRCRNAIFWYNCKLQKAEFSSHWILTNRSVASVMWLHIWAILQNAISQTYGLLSSLWDNHFSISLSLCYSPWIFLPCGTPVFSWSTGSLNMTSAVLTFSSITCLLLKPAGMALISGDII